MSAQSLKQRDVIVPCVCLQSDELKLHLILKCGLVVAVFSFVSCFVHLQWYVSPPATWQVIGPFDLSTDINANLYRILPQTDRVNTVNRQ